PQVLREARERGNLYGETNITTFVAPLLRLVEDDPTGARCELRQTMGGWSRQGFHLQHLTSLMDEGQIDLYVCDPWGACDRLRAQWRNLSRSPLLRIQQLRIFMYNIRARVAVDVAARTAQARPFLRAAERDCRRLEAERNAWPVAIALAVRAGIAAVR